MSAGVEDFFDRLVAVCVPVVERVAQRKEEAYPDFVSMLDNLEMLITQEMGEKAREPFLPPLKKSLGLVGDTPLEELTYRAIAQAALHYYVVDASAMPAIRKALWERGRDAVVGMHERKKAAAGEFVQDFFANMVKKGREV